MFECVVCCLWLLWLCVVVCVDEGVFGVCVEVFGVLWLCVMVLKLSVIVCNVVNLCGLWYCLVDVRGEVLG